MEKELSNPMKCIYIRNGVEIWLVSEKAEQLMTIFGSPNPPQFVKYEGRLINRADLVGVFLPIDMEEMTRRKNGQWKCQYSTWHDRNEKCEECYIKNLKKKYAE